MSHEVESMFFKGETPWHGLGQEVVAEAGIKEAMFKGGLNWEVNKLPIFLEDGTEVKERKATVRNIDNKVLGIVSNKYEPLQNVEAFNFFSPLLEAGLITLETAGSLQGGKKVWVLAKINEDSDLEIVPNDIVRKYMMLSTSHDGTTSVSYGFTPIRVVCANTLSAAQASHHSKLLKTRHSKNMRANLEEGRELINLANQDFNSSAALYKAMAKKQINGGELYRYILDSLGHEGKGIQDISTRMVNITEEIAYLAHYGKGNQDKNVQGTVWGAYNGVTEYLSYHAGKTQDSRLNSLWFGQAKTINARALHFGAELLSA